MTFTVVALSITTLGMMALCIFTLSIIDLIVTLSIADLVVILSIVIHSIKDFKHNDAQNKH